MTIVDTFYHVETHKDGAAKSCAFERISTGPGWAMIGGGRSSRRRCSPISSGSTKIVAVDALPAELAYVEKDMAPVLLAQPTYCGVRVGPAIFDKVHLKPDVPQIFRWSSCASPRTTSDVGEATRDWGFPTSRRPI